VQIACGRIFDIARHDIHRLLSAGLHDRNVIEAGDHHVLGGANAHGVPGNPLSLALLMIGAHRGALGQAPYG
jgi:hypothetical protein